MPRPMQHPRRAPRGTACSVARGTLLPHSMSRKHVPVTARAKVHLRPGQDAQRGREWASRRARHGRVSAADVGGPHVAQPGWAGRGIHLRHERRLQARIPAGQPGGDVVARGMSLQRLCPARLARQHDQPAPATPARGQRARRRPGRTDLPGPPQPGALAARRHQRRLQLRHQRRAHRGHAVRRLARGTAPPSTGPRPHPCPHRSGRFACLFEQGRERGEALFGLALLDSDAGDDRDL